MNLEDMKPKEYARVARMRSSDLLLGNTRDTEIDAMNSGERKALVVAREAILRGQWQTEDHVSALDMQEMPKPEGVDAQLLEKALKAIIRNGDMKLTGAAQFKRGVVIVAEGSVDKLKEHVGQARDAVLRENREGQHSFVPPTIPRGTQYRSGGGQRAVGGRS